MIMPWNGPPPGPSILKQPVTELQPPRSAPGEVALAKLLAVGSMHVIGGSEPPLVTPSSHSTLARTGVEARPKDSNAPTIHSSGSWYQRPCGKHIGQLSEMTVSQTLAELLNTSDISVLIHQGVDEELRSAPIERPKSCPAERGILYSSNRPRSFLWVSLILRHMKFNGTG